MILYVLIEFVLLFFHVIFLITNIKGGREGYFVGLRDNKVSKQTTVATVLLLTPQINS